MIMIGLAYMCTWTSMHTKPIGQIPASTGVCWDVEKPSGFQSPPALLYHLLRIFLLKQPASYFTNIQNDLQIHQL